MPIGKMGVTRKYVNFIPSIVMGDLFNRDVCVRG